MFIKANIAAFLLLSTLQAASARPSRHTEPKWEEGDECPKGTYIFGVRGTLEKPGFGALGEVIEDILKKIPGSDSVALDYPASGITLDSDNNPQYDLIQYSFSKTQGHVKLKNSIREFVSYCPETPFAVLGYSQGAHVVADALCGVGYGIWPPAYPIEEDYLENLKAVVQLGDPTNVADMEWHKGNSTRSGIFPRQDWSLGNCKPYAKKFASWCDENDFFCDRGESIPVHMGYVARYKSDIVDFVVKKLNEKPNTFHYLTTQDEV